MDVFTRLAVEANTFPRDAVPGLFVLVVRLKSMELYRVVDAPAEATWMLFTWLLALLRSVKGPVLAGLF